MGNDSPRIKRRQAAEWVAAGTLGAVAGAGLLCAAPPARAGIPVVLGPRSMFVERTARQFSDHQVAVVSLPEGLAVVRTRCTHLGCALRVIADEWVCPCHGGRFTLDGRVKSGPARAALAWVRAGVDGSGQLWCDPTQDDPSRSPVHG